MVAASMIAALLFAHWAGANSRVPYPVEQRLLDGRPGTIISSELIERAPAGTVAYSLLYRSTGLQGQPIAVSAMVILNLGTRPGDNRPVVAWAHPTSGIVPACAPSISGFRFRFIEGLRDLIGRRFVVVATDYPGLGTLGPHPFLVGKSEGRAVLDSVRAVTALADAGAGERFAVWGHSQGGHAALFTGLLAKNYAPELDLVGVAAAAPATDLATLLTDDINTTGGRNLTAMALWSWANVFDAPITNVLDAAAASTVDRLAIECLDSIAGLIVRHFTERPLEHEFLSVDNITAIEPWRSLLAQNTPGVLPAHIPVFRAGRSGRTRTAGGHTGLHAGALPGRQCSDHAGATQDGPRLGSARQRIGRCSLDCGPSCRGETSE